MRWIIIACLQGKQFFNEVDTDGPKVDFLAVLYLTDDSSSKPKKKYKQTDRQFKGHNNLEKLVFVGSIFRFKDTIQYSV